MTDERPTATWLDSRGRRLDDPTVLVELELRYALTDLMAGTPGRIWTVTELAGAVAARGFTIPGRPGKTVSDALRTELVRGRRSWPRADGPGSLDP